MAGNNEKIKNSSVTATADQIGKQYTAGKIEEIKNSSITATVDHIGEQNALPSPRPEKNSIKNQQPLAANLGRTHRKISPPPTQTPHKTDHTHSDSSTLTSSTIPSQRKKIM